MAEKLQVESFLEECRESGDRAYNALKEVLELLQNPSTRVEVRVFLSGLLKTVGHSKASDNLSIYHFHIHRFSLSGYEGFREDRQSLVLLELPSIFLPEDWSFTFFEGINRLPDNVFRDRDVAELGCGNGWISIALAEKWSPRKMYGLDINPRAIKAAWINLYLNALNEDGSPVVDHEGKTLLDRVEFHESDLLSYCRMHNILLDRIVACIPQILNPDPLAMQKIVSENASEEFLYSLSNYCALQGFVEDQFGLGLIARAVEEGISVVRPSGIMVFNIGGRPGQAVCERLFERRGFRISKLWQTRVNQAADTDILALVEIENNSRHRFEFFMGRVSKEPISARTAWAYAKYGGEISHGLSVYSCQLHQPNQVKTIFKFLNKSSSETRGALDLHFQDDSVAEEKIPFLAHLAHALEKTSSIPRELPVGKSGFKNLIAGFFCSYHDLPISQDNIVVYPSIAVAIEHFLCLYSPELALIDGSLTKLLPSKWLASFSAENLGKSSDEQLFGTIGTVIEAPKQVDLVLQLLLRLKPQVVVCSLADFEMKSSAAFERLLDSSAAVHARVLLDISDYIELSSLPGSNGVLQYLSNHVLPPHATIVCGLLKNKVYADMEVAFIISENKEVLDLMGKMAQLLIGETAISNQFYYGCLFHELLAFQLPGRHSKPNRIPMEEADHFIKAPVRTLESLVEAKSSTREASDRTDVNSIGSLLVTPTSVKMAIFESFARQNITDIKTNPTAEIQRFLKVKLGIKSDSLSNIILCDNSKVLFSKIALMCRDDGGTLFFPYGSNEAYIYAAKLLGVGFRMIQTQADKGFKVTEDIITKVSEISRKPYLYIAGPTVYPTGVVYSDSEIQALISACSKRGAHVIIDTSFSGLEFDTSKSVIWDLHEVDCSNVLLFGNFSFSLLLGGLEYAYGAVQGSITSAFTDGWSVNKPHCTLGYTMKKLLRLYNENDITLHEELMEQRKLLCKRAEILCQVLRESGWEPLVPSAGASLIARPVAYEGRSLSYAKRDGCTKETYINTNNFLDVISDVTGFHFCGNALSAIPGYYQFDLSLQEQDFADALEALKKLKEVVQV
ncbi:hypothetical protein KP509_27G043100 [Ceratopteris richardii]|uniref:Methionine S-methyltransferase n=3 Tax=Ceratopteris richardii TaxID=49495 RepID=A0A8T2RHZ6_CERRI|nr:hypothetical protein KP509_27G043100 [Ceratopteris richardii]KAH7295338.1 hypothetical protein KP509_27G043100 [Ceratopteris richardii]KAH7295339.1 hypothetical protein KP509_27G043100 [Ceratopteris richardii]